MSNISANLLGMAKFPSGLSFLLLINIVSVFGPNISSAIETGVSSEPYFSYKMFTGVAYLLGSLILIVLKLRLDRNPLAKVDNEILKIVRAGRDIQLNRHSLLNPAATVSFESTPNTTTVIQTRIWRHSLAPNTYFFDISKIPKLTDAQHFEQILSKNFPPESFYEVNPVPEIVPKFITESIFYEKLNVRLLPCKALEGEGQVIHLDLSDISFLPHPIILVDLKTTLENYGKVLDVGLKYDSTWRVFMGAGYAVIQQDPYTEYAKLTHSLTWKEDGCFCHATFPDMPTWCRYCHAEGHTKPIAPPPANQPSAKTTYEKPRKSSLPSATTTKSSSDSVNVLTASNTIGSGTQQSTWATHTSDNPALPTVAHTSAALLVSAQKNNDDHKEVPVNENTTPNPNFTLEEDEGEELDEEYSPSSNEETVEYSSDDYMDEGDPEEFTSEGKIVDVDIIMGDTLPAEKANQPRSITFDALPQSLSIPTRRTSRIGASVKSSEDDHHCTGSSSSQSSPVQSAYIRYLRLQKFDIMSLQETHASPSSRTSLDMQFQAQQSFWTYHCGIVSFSSEFALTLIDGSPLYASDHYLLCKVEHPHQFYEPFFYFKY
ncbi:hypothetical protein G6F47_010929 [Rhizopus delemar]|uniref:Endonuclease/exonuclease/phosphatase domain-containing protein n=2 Tax=Rhizopus TaxID=4842 RepID=A0A9P7CKG6_9FUNG|nr:hypothetical protein G6F53_009998 [Rhizopus delemar]KAG1537640.1 hypothetical protein G6F51_010253 [Rhizopus arrhizus]KAG1521107.1 hypothetical protein G6F52_007042 [Rhizopus delemar]KAG1545156.1 hypothetical protein G6F49_010877 [Rhizopus delemar]KAG1565484.1 hypothetical protein G6F50_010032 [Rhizopus delemar]